MNALTGLMAETALVSSASPDAFLVQLFADAAAIGTRSDELWEEIRETNVGDPAFAEQHAQVDRLSDVAYSLRRLAACTSATAIEGLRVKAQYVVDSLDLNGTPEEVALSLARDILGEPPELPQLDAAPAPGSVHALALGLAEANAKAELAEGPDDEYPLTKQVAEALRLGLATKPVTSVDAIALLVMSLAELGVFVDDFEGVSDPAETIKVPYNGVLRATRVLADCMKINLSAIGGDFCIGGGESAQ